jgi:hypothetical protein
MKERRDSENEVKVRITKYLHAVLYKGKDGRGLSMYWEPLWNFAR